MTVERWRLFIDPPYDGATNMAVDETLLEAVGGGNSVPTLRLFAWEPACLSLGYAQHISDADLERIAARGWQIVRRTSGGRAILHTDEITYSVALPESHPLVSGSIVESYRRISTALMHAVEQLGARVNAERMTERQSAKGPVCFEIPSHYELTAGGKKLIGSAQVRRGGAALQHGSLPLTGDISRICDALVFPDESARDLARHKVVERATTLESALGRVVSWNEAAHVISESFTSTFGVQLEPSILSQDEQKRAQFWCETRYGTKEWLSRL